MQVHRIPAVDTEQQRWSGCHCVVVRAIVDQTTQRAVLVLADSSCLLTSLAGNGEVVPIVVQGPCSDACFLCLQSYWPAGTASSASGVGHKFVNDLSPSLTKTGFVEDVPWVLRLRDEQSARKLSGGNGKSKGQSLVGVRREFFVVTAHPAKGGSHTDLRAWSCDDPAFASADIELELGDKRVTSTDGHCSYPGCRAIARLDAPHGVGVKVEASINVLIVYSSSAGKLWVMGGKWSDQTSGPAQTVISKDVLVAEGYDKKCLLLTKCAIVSCHGPVYSVHVSPLHLFLGEMNGVRVWSLRPLIKAGSSGKSSGQSKRRLRVNPGQCSYQIYKRLDCDRCASDDPCQHVTESRKTSGKIAENMCVGNGAVRVENMGLRGNIGVSALKRLSRMGFSTGEVYAGACRSGVGNYGNSQVGSVADSLARTSEFRSLSGLEETLRSDSSLEDDMTDNTTMRNGGGVTKNEASNGISLNYLTDHEEVSIKEILNPTKLYGLKGNLISSNSEALFSIGSRMLCKTNADSAGMCFIALNSEERVITRNTSHADPRPSSQLQVIDVQRLSLEEYLVLDSNGGLHLLTFHDVSEERKLGCLGGSFPTLTHLQITMRVTSLAVLPPPLPYHQTHRDLASPAIVTAKRKLWISDGMHSVHIVILPDEKTKESTYSSTTSEIMAEISQAVFMKDRVSGLVAGSSDTVFVLMEGECYEETTKFIRKKDDEARSSARWVIKSDEDFCYCVDDSLVM